MTLNVTAIKGIGQFSGLIAAATASSAFAADLPARTAAPPPPPMMVPNWQGLFVGGSLGASWLNSSIDDTAYNPAGYGVSLGSRSEANSVGVLGGLQVGYNFQSRNFVYGVEADLTWLGGNKSSANGSQSSVGYYGGYAGQTTKTSRLSALGTIRARVGIDFGGTLPYITGGVAFGQIKNSYSYNGYFGQGSVSGTSWTPGFVIGAGIEHRLTDHLSIGGELLWVRFRDKSLAGPNLGYGGNSGSVQFSNQAALAKIGVNYRF